MLPRPAIAMGIALAALAFSRPCHAASPEESFRKNFPRIPVESVQPSPVPGIYEIATPGEILYYAPEAECFFAGPLITKEGKNLTQERLNAITARKLQGAPLDKAIRIGSGPNTVIEFTDPDCSHCRRASQFFAQRTDATRYVFFLPLGMHKNAEAKVRHVLCRPDRAHAYEEAMTGKLDDMAFPPCQDPAAEALLQEHRAVAREAGIAGTPFFLVNGQAVFGADLPLLERLLGGKQ